IFTPQFWVTSKPLHPDVPAHESPALAGLSFHGAGQTGNPSHRDDDRPGSAAVLSPSSSSSARSLGAAQGVPRPAIPGAIGAPGIFGYPADCMPAPQTAVDRDKLVDPVARDDHARKLVGVKAQRDRERFLKLTKLPLSARETLGVVAGVVIVMAMLVGVAVSLAR